MWKIKLGGAWRSGWRGRAAITMSAPELEQAPFVALETVTRQCGRILCELAGVVFSQKCLGSFHELHPDSCGSLKDLCFLRSA